MCRMFNSTQVRWGRTRRCPHPEKITEFLQKNFNFGSVLTCESKFASLVTLVINTLLQSRTSSSDHTLQSLQSELEVDFEAKEKF